MLFKSAMFAWILLGLVVLQVRCVTLCLNFTRCIEKMLRIKHLVCSRQGTTSQPAQTEANTSVVSALESQGFKELAGLFGVIRLRDEDIPTNINVTVLASTDQVREVTACVYWLSNHCKSAWTQIIVAAVAASCIEL
jgi:hypothetical protein